jgi:quinoprotein glucose dehydrogenase
LTTLLSGANPRVQFYAAQALGRIGHKAAVPALIEMLKKNNDADLFIRHSAVLALSRIEDKQAVYALINSPEKSLRLAAVLVMRKWQDENLSKSLNDKDEYIVAEAARAINDDLSAEKALPALAGLINKPEITSEVIMRRAINAALRVGGDKQLTDLIAYAKNVSVPDPLRAEALATLAVWAEPSVLDRVDGRYRGEVKRDASKLKTLITPEIESFLESKDVAILNSALNVLKELKISQYNDKLVGIYQKSKDTGIRSSILTSLADLNYPKVGDMINDALKLNDMRSTALGMLSKLEISSDLLSKMVENVLATGDQKEKQRLLKSLGEMPLAKTELVFQSLIGKLKSKQLPQELRLDLSDAIAASGSEKLKVELNKAVPKGDIFEQYADVLFGGDKRSGERYFARNETGQCIRCHTLDGTKGPVGPDLSNIGSVLDRKQILQALIEPSARLSPGYGTIKLTLKDGQEIIGILEKDGAKEIVLRTSEAEPLRIAVARVAQRENFPSSMPVMSEKMNRHELRNMIEYLASLKK